MKRVSSQLIFCSPCEILRNSVVEQNEDGFVTRFINLQSQQVETANTLFFDGIISAEIISLKQHLSATQITELSRDYNYIDLSTASTINLENNKQLLIDFGTNDLAVINQTLKSKASLFCNFDAFQFMAACCNYPIEILKTDVQLQLSHKPNLVLWQGLNLVSKQITANTSVARC